MNQPQIVPDYTTDPTILPPILRMAIEQRDKEYWIVFCGSDLMNKSIIDLWYID